MGATCYNYSFFFAVTMSVLEFAISATHAYNLIWKLQTHWRQRGSVVPKQEPKVLLKVVP